MKWRLAMVDGCSQTGLWFARLKTWFLSRGSAMPLLLHFLIPHSLHIRSFASNTTKAMADACCSRKIVLWRTIGADRVAHGILRTQSPQEASSSRDGYACPEGSSVAGNRCMHSINGKSSALSSPLLLGMMKKEYAPNSTHSNYMQPHLWGMAIKRITLNHYQSSRPPRHHHARGTADQACRQTPIDQGVPLGDLECKFSDHSSSLYIDCMMNDPTFTLTCDSFH